MRKGPLLLSSFIVAAVLSASHRARAAPAQAPSRLEANADEVGRAQTAYAAGRRAFATEDFASAKAAFERSLGIVSSPNTALYLARSLDALGEHVDAYEMYGRAIVIADAQASEDTKYAATRRAALDERQALRSRLAFVTVEVDDDDPDAITVGGRRFAHPRRELEVPVAPGSLRVEVRYPDGRTSDAAKDLSAGERWIVHFDRASESPKAPAAAAPQAHEPPWKTLSIVSAGVGAAGVATFFVAGAMAQSTHNQLVSACGAGPCPASAADLVSAGKTEQTIANVGLAVGAIGIACGVTFFVLHAKKGNPKGVEIGAGPTGGFVRGTF